MAIASASFFELQSSIVETPINGVSALMDPRLKNSGMTMEDISTINLSPMSLI